MNIFTRALLVAAVATAGMSYAQADDLQQQRNNTNPPSGANPSQQTSPVTNNNNAQQAVPDNNNSMNNNNVNSQDIANRTANPSADQQLDPTATAGVYTRLSNIVNSAATDNGIKDLIGSLAKTDRDALSQNQPSDYSQLNAKIDQFRKDFRDKYSQDFNISVTQFAGLTVLKGADSDHATVDIGNLYNSQNTDWRSTRTSSANEEANHTANSNSVANSPLRNNSTADDTSKMNNAADNLGNRNAPSKTLGGTTDNPNTKTDMNGMNSSSSANAANSTIRNDNSALGQSANAAAQLRLVHEMALGNGWRLDTTNQGSAQTLADALGRTFDQLHTNQATWPSDADKAYRVIATQILTTVNSGGSNNGNATAENR